MIDPKTGLHSQIHNVNSLDMYRFAWRARAFGIHTVVFLDEEHECVLNLMFTDPGEPVCYIRREFPMTEHDTFEIGYITWENREIVFHSLEQLDELRPRVLQAQTIIGTIRRADTALTDEEADIAYKLAWDPDSFKEWGQRHGLKVEHTVYKSKDANGNTVRVAYSYLMRDGKP